VTLSENLDAFGDRAESRAAIPDQGVDERSTEALQSLEEEIDAEALGEAAAVIQRDLVELGFVSFDGPGATNATSGAMVSEQRRRDFRRDVYVGIRDKEQQREFLGRVVEGPFHAPHEVSQDSAITRTTLLHPERTRFRPTYYAHGAIEIIGEVVANERIVPTATRPRPYSEIYVFPENRLRDMLGISGDFFLGHLMGYNRVQVHAEIASKNFLPRNVGIFGTVGSGKSNTTQVLIEEALKAEWAVVVVDVEGEYVLMDEPTADKNLERSLREDFGLPATGVRDINVYVPSSGSSNSRYAVPFKVPIADLEPEIVADILEFSEPQIRMYGALIEAAEKQYDKQQQQQSGQRRQGVLAKANSDTPEKKYTLSTLVDGLQEEDDGKIKLLGRKPLQHEQGTTATLRGKLYHLGRSGMLDWGLTEKVPYLPVNDLLVGGRLSVLDVSETDNRSRNIAIAYTLKALFDRVIETPDGERMDGGKGRPRPRLLVVIEEVHTFVSRAAAPKMRAVLDNLQMITRRGRKRWMALALVSQQPSHVPDELFELVNTRFIHQLKSVSNLAPVKATTGGVHEALWTTVPALGPGQCLVNGAAFRSPLFVTIRPAQSRRLLSGD
jgi:DNA helicase HerA-like ATPase